MQPVARRTRRRCEQDLIERWRSWKKPKTSSSLDTDSRSSASVSASDTIPVTSAAPPLSNKVEEEVARSGYDDVTSDRKEVDVEDVMILPKNPVIGSSPPIVDVSSSSETEKEDTLSSSEDSDFFGKEEEEANSGGSRSPASVSASETIQVTSAGPPLWNEVEEEVARSGCDDVTSDRKEADEEDVMILPKNPVIGSTPPIVDASSSSETEKEDRLSSSEDSDLVGKEEEEVNSESEEEKKNDESSSGDEGEEEEEEKIGVRAGEAKTSYGSVESQSRQKGIKESAVATRTRSNWCTLPEKLKLSGSIARPIVLDDDDVDVEVIVGDAEKCCQKKFDDGDQDCIDDEEEEEVDESGVGSVVEKIVNKVGKRRPLTADEIHRILFNSIMDDGNSDEIEEPLKPHVTEDEDISASSSDADKSEQSVLETVSLYKMLDFCLACGDDNDSVDLDVEDHLFGTPKKQEQLCKEGKHHLILDEEIGIICKACGIVREEIKHVTPSFHKSLFGVSERSDYYTYSHRDAGGLPNFEDPNCEYQHYQEDSNFDPSGTVWDIIPGLRKTLLPHQREAFEFLWRNVAGGTMLDKLKTRTDESDGGGCLISHAPGTGKTRLAIAFLETYMKLYKKCRPVIIAPASILLTWKKEFKKWKVGIPLLNMNDEELCMEEIAMASSLFKIDGVKKLTLMNKRMIKLMFWSKHQSVLAVSYTLFSQLAGGDTEKQRCFKPLDQKEMIRKTLIELPGLLILDEGHMPRNDRSSMFKVLSEVETKKRFILSGTPFQNNFRELHNILCLVRPELNKEKNPFKFCVDKADEDNIKELKVNMKSFSHCYDGNVVSTLVPGLTDREIYLEPSAHQTCLLEKIDEHKKSHLEVNADKTLISVHPLLFHCKNTNTDFAQELKSRRWDLADGAKTVFLKRLIELSSALEERVLVFSQYLDPLNFMKAVLESSEFGWKEGREILLMSGKQDMETRKRAMDNFNKTGSQAKVMLASTKACSEGIELTGASRVVLLDVTWNPAVERQAISRAYRIGQEKVVHVYHLIMTDNDTNRQKSQTQKNKFSKYVFSSSNREKDVPASSSQPDREDIILERLLEEKVIKDSLQKKSEAGLVSARREETKASNLCR